MPSRVLLALVLLPCWALSQGVSLPVANPGFEAPAIPIGTFSTTAAPPGWNVYGNGIDFGFRTIGVLHPATTSLYAVPVPEGANVGVVFLLDDPANQTVPAAIEAGMEQTLAVPLTTYTQYTLTVEVGNITDDPFPPNNQFQFAGFPGYRIELLAGGTCIASDPNTLLPAEGTFLTSITTFTVGAAHAQAGQSLGIRLVNLNAAPGLEVNFDDVRLEAEPSPAGVGQANVASAALMINGAGVPGAAGPFLVVASGSLTFSWSGPPNTPVALALGPLNPANAMVAGVGTVDIGTPPLYTDVALVTAGVGSPTNGMGTASQTYLIPTLPTGIVFDAQGLVLSTTTTLTAAFRVVLL